MTCQHTPGPWRLFYGPMESIGIGPSAAAIVCEMRRTRPTQWDSRDDDARLIALAPEMAKELRRVRDAYLMSKSPEVAELFDIDAINALLALLALGGKE